MRRSKLPVAAAAVIIALLALVTTGSAEGSYALWTDSVEKEFFSVQAASIKAVHSPAEATPVVTLYNANSVTKTDAITLTNTGGTSASFTTSTALTLTPSTGTLTDGLKLKEAIQVGLWQSSTDTCSSPPATLQFRQWGDPNLAVSGDKIGPGESVAICVQTKLVPWPAIAGEVTLTASVTTTLSRASWTSSATSLFTQRYLDTVPKAPTVSTETITSTSVALKWADPEKADDIGITGYNVYPAGGQTTVPLNSEPIQNRSFTITDLKPLTSYSYIVKSLDGAGHVSSASNMLTVTTLAPAPAAPLLTVSRTGTTATLTWEQSAVTGVTVIGYDVSISINGSASKTVRVTSTTYTDQTLEAGKSYTYSVVAVTSTQRSAPSNVEQTVVPPALNCTEPSWVYDFTVDLNWTAPSGAGPRTYVVMVDGKQVKTTTSTSVSLDRNALTSADVRSNGIHIVQIKTADQPQVLFEGKIELLTTRVFLVSWADVQCA